MKTPTAERLARAIARNVVDYLGNAISYDVFSAHQMDLWSTIQARPRVDARVRAIMRNREAWDAICDAAAH